MVNSKVEFKQEREEGAKVYTIGQLVYTQFHLNIRIVATVTCDSSSQRAFR